ncbi:MAG: O-antigen ligase family protein [Luteolibacter sp.]
MPVVSSIFLVLALVMAVVIGPQTRSWTWGPAMLSLGFAVLAGLPAFWKRGKSPSDFGLIAFGTLVAGWFGWRAWISPVAELGQADLLLVCGTVGTFISIRAIAGNALAERVLIWGITLLLLANVLAAGKQIVDPDFTPVFRERSAPGMITGFFAHYNEAANYFIASSMLVGAAALFGRHALATRIFWILIAIGGLACVWFTRSRGGIFGAALACGVFAAVSLMIGKRRGASWFGPVLIAIPLIGILIGGFLWMGWHDAQAARQSSALGIQGVFDNSSRLFLLGVALSSINLHPMIGGGSRSFSWECFRFFDAKAQGDILTHKPEQVHNELVQAATDYGLIGAGLMIGLLGTLLVMAVFHVIFEESNQETSGSKDAWRLGALAALTGMLVQSCFSFVFHLMPGVILLGICFGQMSSPSHAREAHPKMIGSRILLTLSAIACCAFLLSFGWRGTSVTRSLWPVYFDKNPLTSPEAKIDALTEAIQVWPQSGFHQDRAVNYQKLARESEEKVYQESLAAAIADYRQAAELHPYEPGIAVNQANLLSELQRDSEAEEAYATSVRLQGGMEPGFRAHYSLAIHFLRKGLRQFSPENPEKALDSLELASEHIETAVKQMQRLIPDVLDARLSIHESLGAAREAAGDTDGALECYHFAGTLENGNRAHYRSGILIGKMAAEAWAARRPSEALGLFIKARAEIGTASQLPQGVALSQRMEYMAYLDQTIAFLKGAKIVPSPPE